MNDKDRIAGATKALAIIEAFDEDHPRMNRASIAALPGLTRTAARRYLLTLADAGYAETDGRQFWLVPRVLPWHGLFRVGAVAARRAAVLAAHHRRRAGERAAGGA